MTVLLLGSMLILMFTGIQIAFAILASSTLFLLVTDMQPLFIIPQKLINGLDSFPLIAVPLFIVAGDLMDKGGISKRLVNWCECLVGSFAGGLGGVAIVASAVFAALTGSGPATVAAIGAIMVPSMVERGYKDYEATGLVTASGALGPIIPPSIPMILYGSTMSVSIPRMFSGALIPGIFITILLLTTNNIRSKRIPRINSIPRIPFSWKALGKSTINAIWALIMPIIVLGGIYSGIFTPTEAAAIACVYGLIIGLFVYREVKITELPKYMANAMKASSIGVFITGAANLMGFIFTNSKITDAITNAIVSNITSQSVYLITLMLFLFVVGSLMDTFATILIIAPLAVPAGIALGIDPLFLGVLFVINLVVGFITPPFGCNLFIATAITGVKYEQVVKGVLPYMITEIVAVMIIAFCPWMITWLPSVLF
jgi:C4-dicarboxylate transporter DctM subunit